MPALYRNQGTLRFPRRFRQLALGAVNVIRVVYAPFGDFRFRQYARAAGQELPFFPWMEQVTFQLLSQACLFAGAYIIYRVCQARAEPPVLEVPEG
jgi:hypothetical protein